MKIDRKVLWYPVEDVLKELKINKSALCKKLYAMSVETRTLPGEKGEFISLKAYEELLNAVKGPEYERK